MPRTRPTARELVVDAPLEWVEERSGWVGLIEKFLFRNVPGDTSWLQTLGSSLLIVFVLQATTGVLLAMSYDPSPAGAYNSIRYITDDATLGWLIRGMHKWGSSVMVILLFLHMARTFFFGAYKYPRELTWLTGAILFILVMAMSFTGLPAGVRPARLLGDGRRRQHQRHGADRRAVPGQLPEAGPNFNAETLSRFYSLHMLVIPGAIALFIFLHNWLVVKLGVTSPPWSRTRYDESAARDSVEASR